VYDIGCSESIEVLMHPTASDVALLDPPRECIDHYQDVGVALVIGWKTLEWIVGGACEMMRPDEDL
jgi:hypothetical protein